MAQFSCPFGVFVSNGEVFVCDTITGWEKCFGMVKSSPLQEMELKDIMAMVNWQPKHN